MPMITKHAILSMACAATIALGWPAPFARAEAVDDKAVQDISGVWEFSIKGGRMLDKDVPPKAGTIKLAVVSADPSPDGQGGREQSMRFLLGALAAFDSKGPHGFKGDVEVFNGEPKYLEGAPTPVHPWTIGLHSDEVFLVIGILGFACKAALDEQGEIIGRCRFLNSDLGTIRMTRKK